MLRQAENKVEQEGHPGQKRTAFDRVKTPAWAETHSFRSGQERPPGQKRAAFDRARLPGTLHGES